MVRKVTSNERKVTESNCSLQSASFGDLGSFEWLLSYVDKIILKQTQYEAGRLFY